MIPQILKYASPLLPAVGGGAAYVRKGSVKSLGASLGAALILALCGRTMVGAAAVNSVRVAFGEYHYLYWLTLLNFMFGQLLANRVLLP